MNLTPVKTTGIAEKIMRYKFQNENRSYQFNY